MKDTTITYPILYSLDVNGNVRIWYMEVNGDEYHTVSGLQDGQKVVSGWRKASPKNVGKKNATTAEEQAHLEVEAQYKKKRELGWTSDIGAISAPTHFEPMLASKYEDRKEDILTILSNRGYLYSQPKLDGIRCIAKPDGLWSRTGKRIVACPHIENALSQFFDIYPTMVLDGELYNHDLHDDFNKITSLVKKTKPKPSDLEQCANVIQYHIYDLYSKQKFNMRFLSLDALKIHLEAFKCIKFVPTELIENEHALDNLYESYLQKGYEGQMIRFDEVYENKRSKYLVKRKDFKDDEFEIVRVEEGVGNWAGYAKSLICRMPDGQEFGAGIRGNQEHNKRLLENADKVVGKKATVRYFHLTPDGVPRFGIVTEIHTEEKW